MTYKITYDNFIETLEKDVVTCYDFTLNNGTRLVENKINLLNDLELNCNADSSFLELHLNLSSNPIYYNNSFSTKEVVSAMSGNLIYVDASMGKSKLIFERNKKYVNFDLHLPLSYFDNFYGEHKIIDEFLNTKNNQKSVALHQFPMHITNVALNAINDIKHCTYEGVMKKIYVESKVHEIISQFIEKPTLFNNFTNNTKDEEAIINAAELIRLNISTPLTIEQLAIAVGINQTKLKIGFKNTFHTTIFGYMQNLRMKKAEELLNNTNLSIQEISSICGYLNVSNFSNAFKLVTGFSPLKYRNQ